MADYFVEKAVDWDRRDTVRQLSAAISEAILDGTHFTSEMEVMDFGAGTGLISEAIAPAVKRISAVDISPSMLERLREKPQLQGKVETICQDIVAQPLAHTFDQIVSAMALHHVENTEAAAQSFAAHLKKGGGILLADIDREDGSFHPPEVEGVYHHGFERESLRELFSAAGFVDIEFSTVTMIRKNEKRYSIFLLRAVRAR